MDTRILRPTEVVELVGVSRTTIWRWTKDGRFPKPVRLPTRSKLIGWRSTDIEEWIDNLEQAGGFLARLLNDHPRLHILGSDPQRSGESDVGSAAAPPSGEPPTVGLYSPGQGAPWYVQCRNPDGTVNDSSPPYSTRQAASNVLAQIGRLSVATADRDIGHRAVAEPPSSTCRCSLKGWRCEHIEGPQLEVDPPDRGHGLSL
ncbi:MAG: AlpA family transcriptional regulator [bacterium]|nr:AlpA family transcriptional regulator [bacterium]